MQKFGSVLSKKSTNKDQLNTLFKLIFDTSTLLMAFNEVVKFTNEI
jgi:hypothetical protein